jgi:hypothetical protein
MTADKPKKQKQPAKKTADHSAAIESAVETGDSTALIALLDGGADAHWQDDQGRSLMHYAAAWNDTALLDALTAKGAAVTVFDHKTETPRDYAIAFGHTALAADLQKRMAVEAGAAAPAALPFNDMAALRAESVRSLTDQFNYHVRTGHLSGLLTLAAKNGDGLMAQDVLGTGPDGDSTLLKICQQGRLGDLLDVKLWQKRPEDFQAVWQQVPADYKKGHDGDIFVAKLRQARLQSFSKIRLKDLKPKK